MVCLLLSGPFALLATPDEDLINAANTGDVAKAKVALKAGANPNAKGFAETTPLISAAINGHIEIIKLLIQVRADIHAKNLAKMSALDYAKMHNQSEAVRILTSAGGKASAIASAPARNAPRLQKTGYPEIDAMLSNCWIFDIADAERQPRSFCHQMVDCIGTTIDKSSSCAHASSLVCANYEKDISTRTINSCAGKKTLQNETKKLAMKLAEWVWRKKNYPEAGNSDSITGKNPGNSPKPREKSENQKWRECHASGQSGCGYR